MTIHTFTPPSEDEQLQAAFAEWQRTDEAKTFRSTWAHGPGLFSVFAAGWRANCIDMDAEGR